MKTSIPLVLILLTFYAAAQDMVVSGKVVSTENPAGLPGVNVVVKGTRVGTVTDADGSYNLNLPASGESLVFSFVGFRTQEASIGGRTVIDIQLVVDVTQLSEIVVTGTGVPIEKKKLAFAVESVAADKLPIVPTASIDQALVGRIAGAQISPINGTPGSEISILLRGINTLNRGTQPMILVDGVQMGATLLSSIDQSSIEKVEVIQGAAAATIYGAQGANGVIQLFTKRGKSGKVKIDFSYGVTNSEFLNVGGLRKAQVHGFATNANNEVINPADGTPLVLDPTYLFYSGNVGYTPLDPTTNFNKPYDQNLKYIDHFKMFFKPANTTNYRVALSGGNEKMDYTISVSKTVQESNFIGNGNNDRNNLTLNFGVELAKGLRLRSITQLIYTRNSVNLYEKQDYGLGFNFYEMMRTRPFVDYSIKDVDGNYGANVGPAAGQVTYNPFYEHQYTSTVDKKVDLLQNLNLTYSFCKYVDIDLLGGINYQTRNVRYEAQNQSLNNNSNAAYSWSGYSNGNDNTGEITVWNDTHTFQNAKASAFVHFDFDKDFGFHIPLKSITQLTYDYRSDRLAKYQSYALGMPILPPLSSALGTTFNVPEDYKEEFVTFGYLVNQHFEYKDIAGVSGGFRSDYSSSFGKGSKPFFFPRADGFFRISGLNVWNNAGISKAILEWKVRAAYGEAGIQPRPFDRYVTLSSRALGNTNALFIGANQSNPNLNVEVSKEFEVGTDIMVDGLKGNWLRNFLMSYSYWTRKTDNGIFHVDAAPTTGVGTVLDNAVSLVSNGMQVSLQASILKSANWTWNLTTNFSRQLSTISRVQNNNGEIILGTSVLKAGEPVGQFYGSLLLKSVDQKGLNGKPFIPVDGDINPITEKPYGPPEVQSAFEVASNGWVVNKTSKQPFVTPDKYILGNPNPKFMMAFIQDFSYKKFLTVSIQVDWLNGSHMNNNTKHWMYRDGIHSDYEQPFTINGETGAWSAFYRTIFNTFNNYLVEDASFVRLRNISVGLDFAKLYRLGKLNKLQLVLSGRNLWTRTKYSGMDPEISSYGASNNLFKVNTSLQRGVDDATQPNLRSYQITFIIGI